MLFEDYFVAGMKLVEDTNMSVSEKHMFAVHYATGKTNSDMTNALTTIGHNVNYLTNEFRKMTDHYDSGSLTYSVRAISEKLGSITRYFERFH